MIKNKAIAHYIAKVTGKNPSVQRFDWQDHSLDILSCTENGDDNLLVHSTVGLSGFKTNDEERDVELLLVTHKDFQLAPNVIASAGLNAMTEGWQTATGSVFSNIFAAYYPKSKVKHGLIIPQYLWKESLKNLDLGDRMVVWKMIIPLTDEEVNYLLSHAPNDLLPKFIEQDIDLFNLDRLGLSF